MQRWIGPLLERNEHLVHQRGIRTSRESVLLRTPHLRRCDHLHRFRDLRGVADRFDPAPYVLCVRHRLKPLLGSITSRSLPRVKSDFGFCLWLWLEQTFECDEKIDNCLVEEIKPALKF